MYHRVVISAEYYFMKVYIYNMYTNMKHTHTRTHTDRHTCGISTIVNHGNNAK